MKYGRLDSDFADWPPWKELRGTKEKRDYRDFVATYVIFFSALTKQFDLRNPKADLYVSLADLGEKLMKKPHYVERALKELGEFFNFQLYDVPGARFHRRVVYPNFIRKQTPKQKRSENQGAGGKR